MRFTFHATDRITNRLNGLVSLGEVEQSVAKHNLARNCQLVIEVKRIAYTEINDPSVKPDGIARGDQLVAVVETSNPEPKIITVMLRKSWSKTSQYRVII